MKMKLVKPVTFVLETDGKISEITNCVIDFEQTDYDLFTTIDELRFPSSNDGSYEDVYRGLRLVGAIGSRVECTVKSAVQQPK